MSHSACAVSISLSLWARTPSIDPLFSQPNIYYCLQESSDLAQLGPLSHEAWFTARHPMSSLCEKQTQLWSREDHFSAQRLTCSGLASLMMYAVSAVLLDLLIPPRVRE
ncbi:hypothetical protein DTO271G3_1951 [Paecilomyces variotii]|nr:hypothetical protein DTO271G3_1951 [Paecilomyces variotii]